MNKNFKITSWNVNGLKSLKSPVKSILNNFDSDIICFQEVKTSKEVVQYCQAIIDGYSSYFSFCKSKPGYSGVGIYCRNPIIPNSMEEGLTEIIKKCNSKFRTNEEICAYLDIFVDDLLALESEGRAICAEFLVNNCKCGIKDVQHRIWIFNVYCPLAEPDNKERLDYKYQFNRLLTLALASINSINDEIECKMVNLVILAGDLNIVHKPIDMADSVPSQVFLSNPNRQWFDALLIESQRYLDLDFKPNHNSESYFLRLVDTFRYLHPDDLGCYSCWNTKVGGRQTNFGTRIDYILCSKELQNKIHDSSLLVDIMGSDHCPVTVTFTDVALVPATRPPNLCSCNFPQFRNQSKITSFLKPVQNSGNKRKTSLINPSATLAKSQKIIPSQFSESHNSDASNKWKAILKGPPKPPICTGHRIPSVLRTVVKDSVNKGKKFWVCGKPKGLPDNPDSRCNFFEWASS